MKNGLKQVAGVLLNGAIIADEAGRAIIHLNALNANETQQQ